MQLRKQLWYSFFTIVSLPICLCQRSSAKQDAKITHFMALRLSEMKTAFFFFPNGIVLAAILQSSET